MKLLTQEALRLFQKDWHRAKEVDKWTQAKIAEALEVKQPTFNQYLHGKIPLNAEFLLRYCRVRKIDPTSVGLVKGVSKVEASKIALPVRFSTSGLKFNEGEVKMVAVVPKGSEKLFLVEVDSDFRTIPKGAYLVCERGQCKSGQLVVGEHDGMVVVGTLKRHGSNGWAIIQQLTTGDQAVGIDTAWKLSRVESISMPESDEGEVFGA